MTQMKKIPTRRCTGCGEHFPKSELFRVVRSPEGEITLDKVGKASGRGAYICKNPQCFKKSRKSGRIATALECAIPEEIYDMISEELEVGK
jgi:predicted RNA-binding protein YlxR (DUF448 family)